MIKKILLWTSGIIAALIIFGIIAFSVINENLPEGQIGPEAEELAEKMLAALNYEAYQALDTIAWTFYRGHHFVWDKTNDKVNVKWEDFEVDLSTQTQKGTAKQGGISLEGEALEKALALAWQFFTNDSFWIVSPYKVRDPGTIRSIVKTEEGDALLIHYTSGGVTPGDSYLWILDENYRPKAYKLWVSILPIGGLEFSWEDWNQYNGAWFAGTHKGLAEINISNIWVQ